MYGPDGEEADQTYALDEDKVMTGKLIKGKSRSAGFAFLIPDEVLRRCGAGVLPRLRA
jgi:hypothetical protein